MRADVAGAEDPDFRLVDVDAKNTVASVRPPGLFPSNGSSVAFSSRSPVRRSV
jgi:hypothetical protein